MYWYAVAHIGDLSDHVDIETSSDTGDWCCNSGLIALDWIAYLEHTGARQYQTNISGVFPTLTASFPIGLCLISAVIYMHTRTHTQRGRMSAGYEISVG